MKLIDFTNDERFNALRRAMGAPLVTWGEQSEWVPLDIDAILSEAGIDVDIEDIDILPDGSLVYAGRRVLVYIRDQMSDGGYRFHLADCSTLQGMRYAGKFGRYVVATRADGQFLVNQMYVYPPKEGVLMELRVCKNCLEHMNYKGYANAYGQRNSIWTNFSTEEFFKTHQTKHADIPTHTDKTAPFSA